MKAICINPYISEVCPKGSIVEIIEQRTSGDEVICTAKYKDKKFSWRMNRFRLITDEDLQPLSLDEEKVNCSVREEIFP